MVVQQLVEGKNIVKKGNAIFLEGETIQRFAIVLQGSFDVIISKRNESNSNSDEKDDECNDYTLFTANRSEFIGISGIDTNTSAFTYIAKEDSIIFSYLASNKYEIKEVLENQKEYSNYIITSLVQTFSKIGNINNTLQVIYSNISTFNANLEKYYTALEQNTQNSNNTTFFENNKYNDMNINKSIEEYRKAVEGVLKTPIVNSDFDTSLYNIKKISELIIEAKNELLKLVDRISGVAVDIFNDKDDCIYNQYVKLSNSIKLDGKSNTVILEVLDYTMDKVNLVINHLEQLLSIQIDNPLDKMKYLYKMASEYRPDGKIVLDTSNVKLNDKGIPYELEDSLYKILKYSEVPKDLCNKFLEDMDKFILLSKNKEDENELRRVKKSIEEAFFVVYEQVLKNKIKDGSTDKLYDMFLNYGYMDERLVSNEEIIQLYCIEDNKQKSDFCNIYTMSEWLTAIYKGQKDPSVDDFDSDYYDNFRQLKKNGEITDKEKNSYYSDQNRKLDFEISNLFKRNQKLCFGHPSTYFPILCSEIIIGDIARSFVSTQKVIENIRKILDIDFSLFHREIFCHDEERGLEKEYIMKAVAPDIILTPIFGSRGIMWQPISGRDKSNPARFIIPIFTSENLEDMLINVCGVFRWELCKTIMGVAWSDVTQKSLTSEYADYIQFYRKNSSLSNEAKEKIKNQVIKSRNMLKSIFASDYETWIKYEASGGIRLNKIVRAIMYNYCPFPNAIRERLELQGAFAEAATIYNRNKNKKIKEIENKMTKLSKTRAGVPEELKENLEFYKK